MKSILGVLLRVPVLRDVVAGVMLGVLKVLHGVIQETENDMARRFAQDNSTRELYDLPVNEERVNGQK